MKRPLTIAQTKLFARALATAVILTVSGFQAAWFLGLHLHQLPNGRVIVHSHPVEHTPGTSGRHDHSDRDYAVLGEAGKIQLVDVVEYNPEILPFTPQVILIRSAAGVKLSHSDISAFHKRGPPPVTSVQR